MDVKDMNATPVSPAPQNIPPVNNPAPAENPKKSSGRFLFLMIGLAIGVVATSVIVLTLGKAAGGFGKSAKLEGKGYDTPEEAVMAYAEYLKAGDFDGIVSTFAMESYLENYSMEEYLDYYGVFSPAISNSGIGTMGAFMLDDSDFSTDVNLESRRSYIASNVLRECMVLKLSGVDDDELHDLLEGANPINASDKHIKNGVLDYLSYYPAIEDMEIGDFLDDSDFEVNQDAYKIFVKNRKKVVGGDIENICLELEIDGEDYVLFVTCVNYNDKWYIADFTNYYGYSYGLPVIYGGLILEDDLDL